MLLNAAQARLAWVRRTVLLIMPVVAAVSLQAQDKPAKPLDPLFYASLGDRFHAYIFRTYTDPERLSWLFVDAATSTYLKDPHQWKRNSQGYSYRLASGFGRRIVNNTAQLGFEALLHEDSRYRPLGAHGFPQRVFHAVRDAVIAHRPDGSMEPAYGRIAAGVVAHATSSTWHPRSIGAGALLAGIGDGALDRASGNLLTEFEPDLKAFGRKFWRWH